MQNTIYTISSLVDYLINSLENNEITCDCLIIIMADCIFKRCPRYGYAAVVE